MFPQYQQDPISDHANVIAFQWAVMKGFAKIGDDVTLERLEKWRDMRAEELRSGA